MTKHGHGSWCGSECNWIEHRRAMYPQMRRARPVGIIRNGGKRMVLGCVCGARMTIATRWRRRYMQAVNGMYRTFLAEHDGCR